MNKSTKAERTAEYKGKKYRLLFLGPTKYGKRARLQFWDGSKDFWVDAAQVREVAVSSQSKSQSKSRYEREDEECELCGQNKYTCGHCIGW